jgi:parallel beta-helix repeat protein
MYSGCVFPGLEYPTFLGGGIVLFGLPSNSLNTTITNNTIVSNSVVFSGGGITAFNAGRPLIENNTIAQNTTNDEGAGMWISGNTSPTIIQNLVYDNVITPTLAFPDPRRVFLRQTPSKDLHFALLADRSGVHDLLRQGH